MFDSSLPYISAKIWSLGPKVTKTKLASKELEEQLCILIARLALETRSFPLPEPKTEAVKIIWGLRTANTAFIALVFDEVLPCFPPALGHSHNNSVATR